MFCFEGARTMISFIGVAPTHVHQGSKFTTFAYGNENLPGTFITCVYSPFGKHGWRAVRFLRVPSETPGVLASEFIAERGLTAEEIAYFEGMLQIAGG
jgi:hypothetical protein